MSIFTYSDGRMILKNDRVKVIDKDAIVDCVFEMGTQAAMDYGCFDTGGVLLKFIADNDLQLWPWINEDLVFRRRGITEWHWGQPQCH